jgi:hypothetical protein
MVYQQEQYLVERIYEIQNWNLKTMSQYKKEENNNNNNNNNNIPLAGFLGDRRVGTGARLGEELNSGLVVVVVVVVFGKDEDDDFAEGSVSKEICMNR